MRFFAIFAGLALLSGCAGKLDYVRPASYSSSENEKIVNRAFEGVWKTTVPALGKRFFVINNLDKSSGLINVSYNGDPEQYVDCGRITSVVRNAQGERTYDFPAARAAQQYEYMHQGMYLIMMDRRMDLDGRINLIFEKVGESTRVTANTRYVVKKTISGRTVSGQSAGTMTDSVSFNSGSGGSFPAAGNDGIRCVATGALEREVLGLVN